ncbi:tail fiber assembly [Lentibacter phage vB_LenP_ICBM2]|uniref:Tail assembly chaperone protein n=1 Tax=Lentibacter phage vB_LenP_ICBM2 TaxID=2847823 RepID=A0A3G2YRR9_9CAUD|nr:tail fiber assembly [Lentibacter phage vB_LenP_ICBM2]AYP28111.1 tail assembly chaperone protein [Lentibacter phage vB_LenP_ICBM2]
MNYRSAQYIDSTRIDCEIEHPEFGWIPYTLDPADTDMTIDNNHLLAAMASAGDVAAYVPPTQAELDEAAAQAVRATRDMKLASEVDPIAGNALRWAALDADTQAAWAAYRQALLDVPAQAGFPHNVTWPEVPST